MSFIPKLLVGTYYGLGMLSGYALLNHKMMFEGDHSKVDPAIKERVEQIAKSMQIAPRVDVLHNRDLLNQVNSPALATGFNSKVWSCPAIYIEDTSDKTELERAHNSKEKICSIAAHELAHIKHSDPLRAFAIGGLTLAALTLIPHRSKNFIGRSREMLAFTAAVYSSSSLYMRHQERKADLEAIKHMTKGELAAATKFYGNEIYLNRSFRELGPNDSSVLSRSQNIFIRVVLTKAGNHLSDFRHPLLTTRYAYFREAFEAKEGTLPLELEIQDGQQTTKIPLQPDTIANIRKLVNESNRSASHFDAVKIIIHTNLKKENVKIQCVSGDYRYSLENTTNLVPQSTDESDKIVDLFKTIIDSPRTTLALLSIDEDRWNLLQKQVPEQRDLSDFEKGFDPEKYTILKDEIKFEVSEDGKHHITLTLEHKEEK